jgi:hypothetical protein
MTGGVGFVANTLSDNHKISKERSDIAGTTRRLLTALHCPFIDLARGRIAPKDIVGAVLVVIAGHGDGPRRADGAEVLANAEHIINAPPKGIPDSCSARVRAVPAIQEATN